MHFAMTISQKKFISCLLLDTLIHQIKYVDYVKHCMGLKWAHCAQYSKFSSTMEFLDFKSSSYDHALFVHRTHRGDIILLFYVDDMIIIDDDQTSITKLQQYLNKQFGMKDFGLLGYILGLEVAFGYNLSQEKKHATDLFFQARPTNNKIASTTIESNAKFNDKDGIFLPNPTFCQQLVGNLIYLTIYNILKIRPNFENMK